MRRWTGCIALGLLFVPLTALADGEIVIELKPPPPATSVSGPPPSTLSNRPGTGPVGAPQTHVAVARRGPGAPPKLPAVAPERTFGQLGVTLAPENPIYRKPDPRSEVLSRPRAQQYLVIQKPVDSWYAVLMADGSTGYLPATSIELLDYRVTDVQLGGGIGTSAVPRPVTAATPFGAALIQECYRYLGVPYVWGGNDERGLDCSGFVKRCFGTCGVPLPRTASEQARVGQPVEFSALQTGDRLYFSVHKEFDHTGIYIGDGYFIHSSSGAGGVVIDHLSRRFYARTLAAARR
jgi:hypothetical protein